MSNEFFTLRVNGTDHEVADSWLGESCSTCSAIGSG